MQSNSLKLVIPGEIITEESKGYMAGWGTYSRDGNIIASVAGAVQTVDKLINIVLVNMPYKPEQGDVVIGRIISVDKKSWKVNINYSRDATLNLVNINLPHGEQRRRSEEDYNLMKNFFTENDLLSGEVLSLHNDGSVSLQTRNLKYGKLKNGLLIKVNTNLVKKMRIHFIELLNNIKCILGKNGYIWIYYSSMNLNKGINSTQSGEYFSDDHNKIEDIIEYYNRKEEISKETAGVMVLLKNVIISLDNKKIQINKASILMFFNIYCKENNLYSENNQSPNKIYETVENIINLSIKNSALKDNKIINLEILFSDKLFNNLIINESSKVYICKTINNSNLINKDVYNDYDFKGITSLSKANNDNEYVEEIN